MYLAGTDHESLVELPGVDTVETAVFAASDHVRTGIGIAQQSGCDHVGDELGNAFPGVFLVA